MLYLVSLIKTGFYKIANFLFGKTWLFIIILGWFLIITGILFLVNPEKARKNLISRSFGFVKWPMFFLALYIAALLISFASKAPGAISIILVLASIVVVVRAFIFLRKKTRAKLTEQFAKVPIKMLKIFAVFQICIGSLMLIIQRRIW